MGKRRTRTDRGDANGGPSVSPTRDDAQEKKRRTRTQKKETSQDYAAKVQSAREPEDTFATHLAERDTPDVTADETRRRDENGKLVRFRMHCDDGEEVRVLSNRNDMNSTLGCRVPADLEAYSVKERLRRHWGTLHRNKTGGREGEDMENEGHEVMEGSGIAPRFVSARQACLFSALHRYADVCLLGREMPDSSQRSPKDPSLDALLLHVVNHVMKTSDLVKRGNEAAKASKAGDGAEDAEPQRDQGFTRGKVLVLLPLRKFAFHFVRRLMRLVMLPNFGHKHFKSVPGGAQFLDEYGDGEEEELGAPSSKHMQGKPKDFRDTFSGNTDDHFRLGVKLTKSSVKLYSDFYKSDIIVASPLGLVTLINDAERTQEKAFEFLSSIEVLCVDHADVLMMQNWEHVLTICRHACRVPAASHGADVMRIREWCLAGHSRSYLQTVVFSSYATADLNNFCAGARNFEGLVKFPPQKSDASGVTKYVTAPVKQLFMRLADPGAVEEEADRKMDHFCKEILGRVLESYSPGVLIFARSYFDFLRLRRKLDDENADFAALSEYTERSDADRIRSHFASGKTRILLYSERAHFYFRYKLKGVRDVVFYSLPDHCVFYSEILSMVDQGKIQQPTSTALFSKYDALQLGRVVGTREAKKMLTSETETFLLAA